MPGNNLNNMLELSKKNNSGFMMLEAIISIAIIVIAFTALMSLVFSVVSLSGSVQKQTQADSLIKEEFEAIRNFRDGTKWATTGLGVVTTGSPYYLVNNAGKWALTAGTETQGNYTRKVVFDKVSRDASGNIEATYNQARVDNDTIKITVTVTYPGKTMQDVTYLTNWKSS